nr:unnamed protein product [Digitaria exilis]
MMKQIFGWRKAPKTAEKEFIGTRRNAALNQVSGSEVANLSSQLPVLSSTGHTCGSGDRMRFNYSLNDSMFTYNFRPLPSIKDAPNTDKQNLLVIKLNMCCTLFDFMDPTKDKKEKEMKVKILLEILDYVRSASSKFPEIVVEAITTMISANLFRTLVSSTREKNVLQHFDLEEDEPLTDPAWPHLHPVYEVFLQFLQSPETDAKLAKRYVDHFFILRMLELFQSEDHRERNYLKTILHRIYGKFMVYRPFIRKSINNIFYQFIYETQKHNGIAELLEILGSIINGFALPLKEEHKLFLVAEKALFLWNNDRVESLIKKNSEKILPIILPALDKNINGHWNPVVQSLSLNMQKLLSDREPELFAECVLKYEEGKVREDELKLKQEAAWKHLEEIASAKVTSGEAVLVSPTLPRQPSAV